MRHLFNLLAADGSASLDTKAKIIIGVVMGVVGIGLIIATVLIVHFILKKKRSKELSEEITTLAQNLFSYLGGKDNIAKLDLTTSRLEVTFRDIDKLNKTEISNLRLGATIANDIIKISLKENSRAIYKELTKLYTK